MTPLLGTTILTSCRAAGGVTRAGRLQGPGVSIGPHLAVPVGLWGGRRGEVGGRPHAPLMLPGGRACSPCIVSHCWQLFRRSVRPLQGYFYGHGGSSTFYTVNQEKTFFNEPSPKHTFDKVFIGVLGFSRVSFMTPVVI